jgi:ABC-type nitrate/sulfonate/bicarbonate transport system substrate-binding protein
MLDSGGAVEPEAPTVGDGGYSPVKNTKVYIRRKGQILIFDNDTGLDAYLDAEQEAQRAIDQAQKTSRRARKRLRERLQTEAMPMPAEVVQEAVLDRLSRMYGFTLDTSKVACAIDEKRIIELRAAMQRLQQYEEDVLVLLLSS